jgi:hypothetical protein
MDRNVANIYVGVNMKAFMFLSIFPALVAIGLACETYQCNQEQAAKPKPAVNEYSDRYKEFAPYVKTFMDTAKSRGYDPDLSGIDIYFAEDLPNQFIGVCYSTGSIFIKQSVWNKDDDTSREQLIWHELGHCALGKAHNNAIKNGHAVSLMNSSSVNVVYGNEEYYIQHKQDYIDEFLPIVKGP